MAPKFLSENDPDLKLARQIRRYLQGADSPSEDGSDSLLEVLMAYKQHINENSSVPPVPTQLLWKRIEQKTQPDKLPVARLHSLNTLRKRALLVAAACVVAAVFVGIFYLTLPSSPTLLAKSEATIETITLEDGSKIILRPHSSLLQISGTEHEANYRLEGEAFFQITHNPNRVFTVEAGDGKVSVLGTQFGLSSWGGITQVFLKNGAVKLTHLTSRESVILEPGQSALLSPKTHMPQVSTDAVEAFTDWMQNRLVFNNKPAGYVFKELEHHFNIEILAPDSISSIPISSGGLTLENEQASLDYVGLVLGGSFRLTGPETFTFVANQ